MKYSDRAEYRKSWTRDSTLRANRPGVSKSAEHCLVSRRC